MVFGIKFLQLLDDLVNSRPIGERLPTARVANHSISIDEEGRGAIAELRMDPHLKRHAIRSADNAGRVEQQRVVEFLGRDSHFLEKVLRRIDFVRIDRNQLRAKLFQVS